MSENNGTTVIDVSDVTKTYRMGSVKVNAHNGVSLQIVPGEMVALRGPPQVPASPRL